MKLASTLVVLVLAATAVWSAEPKPEEPFTAENAKAWAGRIQEVVGREGWSVTPEGDEITIERLETVVLADRTPNEPASDGTKEEPRRQHEATVRFVLSFGPRLSMEQYSRRAAENAATVRKYEELHRAVGLPYKFDHFIATTPEEEQRVQKFQEAVAKLPQHDLPDLYSPDHSIHFTRSWNEWSSPADKETAAEIREVEALVERYFGIYDWRAARRDWRISKPRRKP